MTMTKEEPDGTESYPTVQKQLMLELTLENKLGQI